MTKVFTFDGGIGQGPGEISALAVRAWLPATGEDVAVHIHSEGGSLVEAFAIHDILKAYAGRVVARVEAMAFSAAAIVAMAADEIEITPNAYMMVHDASKESGDLRPSEKAWIASLNSRQARIVAERTGKPEAAVRKWMAQELFFDAEAAVTAGLAQRITSPARLITARALPARVVAKIRTASPAGATARARWSSAVRAAGSVSAAAKAHPQLRQAMLVEANADRPNARIH